MNRSANSGKVEASATSDPDYFVLVQTILLMITESEKVHFNRESPILYAGWAVRCRSASLGIFGIISLWDARYDRENDPQYRCRACGCHQCPCRSRFTVMSVNNKRQSFIGLLSFAVLVVAMGASVIAANPAEELVSAPNQVASEDSEKSGSKVKKEAVATLAGGCFWCTEAVYERMRGVNDVVSGYIGGHVKNPTYQQVCGKKTGHAEAVEIYYDPSKTTYEELLEVFFKTHDPTTLNRQGADEGPQYRSAVFFHDDKQKAAAKKYIAKLNAAGDGPIVTTLEFASKFYPAEEYHQDYFARNPNAGYCRAVVRNKVRKFNREFGDKIKKKGE